MSIKLVVCDIAGTTVVDKDFVSVAFIEAFLEEGIDLDPLEIKPLMGFKKTEAIMQVLNNIGMEYNDTVVMRIHDNFERIMIRFYSNSNEVEGLPGVEEFFDFCRENGTLVALNSGFPRKIVDVIMDRMGWVENGQVALTIASDEVAAGRPSPLMIQQLMEKLGIQNSSEVLKVGDTMVDIQEGRNAECGKVIGITTGTYSREQLEVYAPDHIIDNLLDLKRFL